MFHLVFSLGASLLDPHWLVSLCTHLSSPGWSFVCLDDQVREVLERTLHLKAIKETLNQEKSLFLSVICSFALFFHPPFKICTHSGFDNLGAEA